MCKTHKTLLDKPDGLRVIHRILCLIVTTQAFENKLQIRLLPNSNVIGKVVPNCQRIFWTYLDRKICVILQSKHPWC